MAFIQSYISCLQEKINLVGDVHRPRIHILLTNYGKLYTTYYSLPDSVGIFCNHFNSLLDPRCTTENGGCRRCASSSSIVNLQNHICALSSSVFRLYAASSSYSSLSKVRSRRQSLLSLLGLDRNRCLRRYTPSSPALGFTVSITNYHNLSIAYHSLADLLGTIHSRLRLVPHLLCTKENRFSRR